MSAKSNANLKEITILVENCLKDIMHLFRVKKKNKTNSAAGRQNFTNCKSTFQNENSVFNHA